MKNTSNSQSPSLDSSPAKPQQKYLKFLEFIEELEVKAKRRGLIFERAAMPGAKRDLLDLLRRNNEILADLKESSLEEYMKKAGCKFPAGNVKDPIKKKLLTVIYEN